MIDAKIILSDEDIAVKSKVHRVSAPYMGPRIQPERRIG